MLFESQGQSIHTQSAAKTFKRFGLQIGNVSGIVNERLGV